jgi:hypothetical protein
MVYIYIDNGYFMIHNTPSKLPWFIQILYTPRGKIWFFGTDDAIDLVTRIEAHVHDYCAWKRALPPMPFYRSLLVWLLYVFTF